MTEPQAQHELSAIPSADHIQLAAQLGMDEVAAIRVAQIESDLLIAENELRDKLTPLNQQVGKMVKQMEELIPKETRAQHPEIAAFEGAYKKLFGKDVAITIACHGEYGDGKVSVSFTEDRYNSKEGSLKLNSAAVKELSKEIESKRKDIAKIEDDLVKTKKALQQLPSIERRAKAAVAQIKLEGTTEGKKILSRLSAITIPGLPAPKK